mgnify:CR=1 FL=1
MTRFNKGKSSVTSTKSLQQNVIQENTLSKVDKNVSQTAVNSVPDSGQLDLFGDYETQPKEFQVKMTEAVFVEDEKQISELVATLKNLDLYVFNVTDNHLLFSPNSNEIYRIDSKFLQRFIDIFSDKSHNEIYLLVGPEGGFSEKEIELFKNSSSKNVKIVKCGNNIMRSETACIMASCLCLTIPKKT